MRVSTNEQDLERQEYLIEDAKRLGYYIAGIYKEKASGANPNRPVLNKLIDDLQEGDVLICENIDRLTRLPLPEAKKLMKRITEKAAVFAIPEIIDLSFIINTSEGIAKIALESTQTTLRNIVLYIAHKDYMDRLKRQRQGIELAKKANKYKGRTPNKQLHQKIIDLRTNGVSISKTAAALGCSVATVTNVMAAHRKKLKIAP